jgi:integrase
MTIKVTLRDKPISKGRKSLYLDFYPPIPHPKTGEPTRREFLGIYTFEKPKTSTDKHHNSETQKIAESIRQKKENLLNKPEIYSQYEKQQLKIKEQDEINFVEYFRKLANKRKASNYDNWISALHYLEAFTNGNLKFADLNEMFLEDFKYYLLSTKSKKSDKTTLSQNSAVSYFNKVKATIKQAYKDGILQTDLNAKVSPIKTEETRREHLTIEELTTLAKTPFSNELLKRAVLFSALTGLRFSDIQKMRWNEMEYIKEQGYFINFNQQKTKGVEVHPISEQAYNFTKGKENPKDMEPDKNVFENLTYSAYHNKQLAKWILEAGITYIQLINATLFKKV